MNIIITAKVNLEALEQIARVCPRALDEPPVLIIDGGAVRFNTLNEVVEYVRAVIARKS